MVQVLGRPHLVLAHVGDIDRVGAGLAADLVDHLVGLQLGVAVHRLVVVGLPFPDLLHPVPVLGGLDVRQDGLQNVGRVAHQRQVDGDVFAHLAGVDVNLDVLCIVGEGVGVQRHPVGKAGAHGDDQIGLVHRLVGGVAAVHAQKPQVQRLAVGQHAGGHQGVGGGDLRLGQQVAQRLAACRAPHAAAEHDDGAFRLVDQPGGFQHAGFVVAGDGAHRLRRLGGKLAAVGSHVLGDVHQHRAFAAALGNAEGGAHGVGQILDPADGVVVLGDGHGHALDVGFLKAVLAQQRGGHVAGKGDHRDAVHEGGGNAGDQVGGAGAAGGQHHAGAPGGAGIPVRRVGRALLVRGQDMPDAVGVLVQFVVQVQHRAARIPENGIHALLGQHLDKNLGTCQHHRDPLLFLLWCYAAAGRLRCQARAEAGGGTRRHRAEKEKPAFVSSL